MNTFNNRNYRVTEEVWNEKLNEVASSMNGAYLYPQVGQTRVRLMLAPEREPDEFYQEVKREFKGKTRTQYLIPVIMVDPNGTWSTEIKIMCAAKTVLKGILTILASGEYDLLHPEEGHGLTIGRTGQGLNTEYSVLPSKSPVPVDYEFYTYEKSLLDYAADLENNDNSRSEGAAEEEVPF